MSRGESKADRTKFRCRVCREQKGLSWTVERRDLAIVTGPTGKDEFEALCGRCLDLTQAHERRKKLHIDFRIQLELREMLRLRDEIRSSGVDIYTANTMAAELTTAAADPPVMVDFLKGWSPA